MDIRYAKQLLIILVENVTRLLNAGFGVNHAESSLFQVVGLLQEEPDLKEVFLERVQFTLNAKDPRSCDEGMVPVELIELVTHELKWPELKSIADARIRDKFDSDSLRAVGDVSIKIYDAFNDDWEDREFYAYYQS